MRIKNVDVSFSRFLFLLVVLAVSINLLLLVLYIKKRGFLVKKIQTTSNINSQVSQEKGFIEAPRTNPLQIMPPTPSPTHAPRPIPKGRGEFTASASSSKGPQMNSGFIDPTDPGLNVDQTISIKIKDTVPVKKVTVTIKTDNQSPEIPMKLVEGTAYDGRWEATHKIKDSYLYQYSFLFKVEDETMKDKMEITLR